VKLPVRIYRRPRLNNPYLIIGWSDAGFVGINAVDYLIDGLGAKQFGEIEPYDFSLTPHISIKGSVVQEIEYPGNNFYYHKTNKPTGDYIIMSGKPPAVNHYRLANLILDVAEQFEVSRIYTVGGIYSNSTHDAEPRVFAILNNSRLREHVARYDLELGREYYGPSSINGLILGVAQQRNIEGISLWGGVPSYIAEIPNPQICYAVLRILIQILDIDIDLSRIEAEARQATKQINELVSYLRRQSPSLDQHIDRLEKGLDVEISEEDTQSFFKEIEEFLRKPTDRREND